MDDIAKYWKEQYEELRIATDLAIDQITIADGDGVIWKVNKACEQYFGVKEHEIIGKSGFEMEREGVFNISATAEVVRRKQKVRFVQETKSKKVLLVTGYPFFDKKGNLVKIINISNDITDKNVLEKELRDTEAKLEWYRNQRHKSISKKNTKLSAESKNMYSIKKTVDYFADKDILILLLGETGVGKSYLANYIHSISNRSKEPFVTINCGAIPHNLLESELFGYEKGSFTGALTGGKQGLFEIASNGTIFLDEIADLPFDLQVKFLTVLDNGKFRKIGGSEDIDLNARILVATNKDLLTCVEEGTFREDLYYRINVFPIKIPKLSDRIEDLPNLVEGFLKMYNKKYETDKRIGAKAYEELMLYSYPGNIRELKNIIERLILTSRNDIVDADNVKEVINFDKQDRCKKIIEYSEDGLMDILPLKEALDNYEKKLLEHVCKKYKTTREQAKILGINQSTIVRKRQKYSI